MKKPPLHWQVIIGLIFGIIYAWLAVQYDWEKFTLDYILPFGDIFISILKMIAVPLVLFSIIAGIISLGDVKKLGKMGVKTLVAYLLTTFFAVTLGLTVVNLMGPGRMVGDEIRLENRIRYELWKADNPNVIQLDNICESCKEENLAIVEKIQKEPKEEPNDWVKDKLEKSAGQKNKGPLQPLVDVFPDNIFKSLTAMAMLQVIFFAIFFGLVLLMIPKEKAEPVEKLIDGLNEIFVKMVWVVMQAMPFFVFALMAGQIVKTAGADPDKFIELLSFLSKYSVAVIAGLVILAFIIYPLLALIFAKIPIPKFLRGVRDAQVTAFSTSSSVATLPVTMDVIQNKLGVSKSVSSFVLPIGATVNMDGTSLYQAVAVVAMAQFHMIELELSQQLVIIITATLASIGAAAVPSAGLVLMILVLESVGLNPAWIALIFPVDRILDMCRTVVNVTGDATVSSIIARSEGELKTD